MQGWDLLAGTGPWELGPVLGRAWCSCYDISLRSRGQGADLVIGSWQRPGRHFLDNLLDKK